MCAISISPKVMKGLVKATGLASVGMCCYDAHVIGKLDADTYYQSKDARRISGAAYNNLFLEQPSTIMGKIKNKILGFTQECDFMRPIDSLIGYLGGFGSSIISNIVPFGLGLVALLGKGKRLPKLSALGVAFYGAYQLLREGFGVGRPDRLNPPFK